MESGENVRSYDLEGALLQAGYGKFQAVLLAICGAIYAACAISTTTISFVLPAAECDFKLTSTDKGSLTATPLLGMIIGSFLWGPFADYKGRKWIIVACLFIDAMAAVFSSLTENFYLFLFFRFMSGFGIIGATSLIFSYLGEFQSNEHRDVILSRLEVFWTLGIILLPCLAWIIIPQKWIIGTASEDAVGFDSWRIFVAICGMPSFTTAMILCVFPESPRFLMAKGRQTEARHVLQIMYSINTGQIRDAYPVPCVESLIENREIQEIGHRDIVYKRFFRQIREIWNENKIIIHKPYLGYLVLTCFTDFGIMASYYTLIMWLPDLFDRYNKYQMLHPDDKVGICDVNYVIPTNNTIVDVVDDCTQPLDMHVYLYTIIIGLSCIPTSISLGLAIRKLGKKWLLVISLLLSGLAAFALNWVENSVQNLVVACLFESITSITETVIFCLVVDLFPTKIRALALSLTVTTGRIGAITGNIIFGMTIDLSCRIPINMFGILLIVSGLLCFAVPNSRRRIVSQNF